MDIFHKKERKQLVQVVVILSILIVIMAVVLGYFIWHDSTRACPPCLSGQINESSEINPGMIDSDEDGLSDADEITVYKTDPDNPDTDSDGYGDGLEVTSGYNPLGEGKLTE